MSHPSDASFARRTLLVVAVTGAVAGVLLFAALIIHVLLLLFAAILGAIVLDALADGIHHWLPIPRTVAVLGVVTVVLGLGVAAVVLWGPVVVDQLVTLSGQVPAAVDQVSRWLSAYGWNVSTNGGPWRPEQILDLVRGMWGSLAGAFTSVLAVATGTVALVMLSIFLALDPPTYVESAIRLVPIRHRERAHEIAATVAHALRLWLIGRLTSMTIVGLLTLIGLLILGAPQAFSLALIAGILTFVPYLGPALAAVPAILAGLAVDATLTVSILVLYVAVQLAENNVITPLVQSRAVSLPPAMLIVAQIAMALVFGFLGVLLATPLTVTAIVLVQMLYVQDVLQDSVRVIGAPRHHGSAGRSSRRGEKLAS